jgi:uncharacterized protein with NRDE domain
VCFILALFGAHPRYPLVIAANRDEARARPSTAPHLWPGAPAIWAGRDDVAGGTWLGVNTAGLVAAITNRVGGPVDPTLPSRGQLCLATLRQPDLPAARATIEADLAVRGYNPFNLLVATGDEGWVTTWRGASRALSHGAHIVTNHGDMDNPSDPAVPRALEVVEQLNVADQELDPLLQALGHLCSDTREPNPICRPEGDRGTVSSSLIALDVNRSIAAYWHADGPPTSHEYRPIDVGVAPVA